MKLIIKEMLIHNNINTSTFMWWLSELLFRSKKALLYSQISICDAIHIKPPTPMPVNNLNASVLKDDFERMSLLFLIRW